MSKLFNDYFMKIKGKSDNIAVISEINGGFKQTSFAQLNTLCYSIQKEIGRAEPDERIAIIIDNRLEFIVAFLTAIYSGYTVVAINSIASIIEKEKILTENNIKKILSVSELNDNYDNQNVYYIDRIENIEGELYQIESGNLCLISYTSGTSGMLSKGVKLTYRNIKCTVKNYKKIYKLGEEDRVVIALPLWHNYGMIAGLCSAFYGCCKILVLSTWNAEIFIKMVKDYRATVFPGSPYMYMDIANNYKIDNELCSLRICDSGGDMLPLECIKKFEALTGAIITEGYGLTETSSLTHFNYSAKERKIGSIGRCVDGVECKIKDLAGNEMGYNKWGILFIRGEMVFDGYVNQDCDMLDKDNWFNTNDIVKLDSDGYFYIAGRYSDIKNLDETVDNNRRIENDIYKYEKVERAFVKRVGVKQLDISCYKIFVILKKTGNINDFKQYINQAINYAVVDEIAEVNEFSVTGTGKIKRMETN